MNSIPSTWDRTIPWPAPGRSRVYDLAQPLEPGIPHHPAHPPYAFSLTKKHGEIMYLDGVSAASELICLGGHVGTHVDGLGHVSKDGKIHGGHDVTEGQSYTRGVAQGAIDTVPPFLARGHLVDVPTLLGRPLTPDDVITGQTFEAWFASHPPPEKGDVVLVRTGWDEHWTDNSVYLGGPNGNPGVDVAGARWLTERGVVATGSDTIAYEKLPTRSLPVHVHLLVESGVHIMEALYLKELASAGEWEFFFLAIPLRIRGGTGSPIRPLAFVAQEEAP